MNNELQFLLEQHLIWPYDPEPVFFYQNQLEFWRSRLLLVIQRICGHIFPPEITTLIFSCLEINNFLFSIAYQLARRQIGDMRILPYITGSLSKTIFESLGRDFDCSFMWVGFNFIETLDFVEAPSIRCDVESMQYFKLVNKKTTRVLTFAFNLLDNNLSSSLHMVNNVLFPRQICGRSLVRLIQQCIELRQIECLAESIVNTVFIFDYSSIIDYPITTPYTSLPTIIFAPSELELDGAWMIKHDIDCNVEFKFPMTLAEFLYRVAITLQYSFDLVFIIVGEVYYRIGSTETYARLGIYDVTDNGYIHVSSKGLHDLNGSNLRPGTLDNILNSSIIIESN